MSSEGPSDRAPIRAERGDAGTGSDKDLETAADLLARGAQVVTEDPTRSNVHTGTLFHGDQPAGSDPTDGSEAELSLPGDALPATADPGAQQEDGAETPPEAAAGAVVGNAPAIDGDPRDSSSFAVSTDRVEVTDSILRSQPGVGPNPGTAATAKAEVTASDASGLGVSDALASPVAETNQAPESVTLMGGAVPEGTAGAVVGRLSVVDPDAGDSHSFTVSDDRFEVVEGVLRLRPDIALDHGSSATVEVEVTATDAGGLSVSETLTINVVLPLDVQVESGFHARYFDMDKSLSRLDDVDWDRAPAFDEVVQDINYTNSRGSFWEGGDTDTFAAEITGTIQVDEAGRFEFFLSGDDGARLYINGQPVVENDGLHSYRTRSGDIHLEPGLHHVEVQYFENYGFAGLRLEWDGPGTEGRTLVTPAGEADVQAISGMPTALQMSFPAGGPPDGTTVTLVGLPEGTQVAAAGDVGVVDASGAFDITGWDISLLTVEPPIDFVGLIDACVLVENVCGAEHRVPLTIDVGAAQPPAPSAAFVGGFQASYFDVGHSLRKVDDINWDSDPTHTEYIADINYANSRGSFWEGGPTDMFGVKVEGEIEVTNGGTYTFFAGGDDGVVVLIDGQPVVENDGLHGFRTRSGEIELEPGTYDIEVLYFENHGYSGLKLEWDGPDTDGRELLQAAPALEIAANGTFELALDVQGSSGASGVVIEGLPAGTIISSGDVAQIVDHQAVDVSQWDLSTIEISPPPGFEGVIEGSLVVTDTAFNGAPVTGATPFSLTVGDPQAGSDPLPDDGLTVSSADPHAAEDWGAPDLDTNLETSDDVMTERVVESGADDALQVSLDSYELSDL